jgi:hypothetical protein
MVSGGAAATRSTGRATPSSFGTPTRQTSGVTGVAEVGAGAGAGVRVGEETTRAGAWRKERRPLSRQGSTNGTSSSTDLMRVSVKIDPQNPLGLSFAHGPNGPAVVKTVTPEGQLAEKVSS